MKQKELINNIKHQTDLTETKYVKSRSSLLKLNFASEYQVKQ